MLIDNKILTRHGIYEVLAESHTVVFRDDSKQRLQFVQRNGVTDLYLRAFERAPGRWCLFDLRVIDRRFALDLQHALHRDRPGMVMFSLRDLFRDASAFLDCCMQNLEGVWREVAPIARRPTDGVQTSAIAYQAVVGGTAA